MHKDNNENVQRCRLGDGVARANPEKSALDLQNLTVAWNGLDLMGFQLHLLAGLDNTHLLSND